MAESVTLKIDEKIANEMVEKYASFKEENSGEYVYFFARLPSNIELTIYSSKKGYKALFLGNNCIEEAKAWDSNASINIPKEHVKTNWKYLDSQIGSDEVGTGDFFGPVVVVASYVPKDMIPKLKELGVDDSKKLTDSKIKEIINQIQKDIVFCRFIVKPEKYNEMIDKGFSMNEIKAILHNQALINVREKINDNNMPCFVDQFTPVDTYYKYLAQRSYTPLTNNITFETKGESFYPSVAVSSMIARASFLDYMDELSANYRVEIPKGASLKVDEIALKIMQKHGIEEMNKLVKKNFSNYQKLIQK